jgi:ankyrin repeat protein
VARGAIWGVDQYRQFSPFRDAAVVGSLVLLDYIIRNCESLSAHDFARAIGGAFRNGHLDACNYLLEKANKAIMSKIITEILEEGAPIGSIEVAQILAPYFAEVDDLTSVIEIAAAHRNVQLAKYLMGFQLKKNADVSWAAVVSRAIRSGDIEIPRLVFNSVPSLRLDDINETVLAAIRIGFLEGIKILFQTIDEYERKELAVQCVNSAIRAREGKITAFLMSFNHGSVDSLVTAVNSGSLALLKSVLARHHSPEFINQQSEEGSALCVAAALGNLAIVELLLSVPRIDANLYDCHNRTALIIAATHHHFPVMKAIADFCCPQLDKDAWQVNAAFVAAFEWPRERQNTSSRYSGRGRVTVQGFSPSGNVCGSPRDNMAELNFEMIPFFLRFSCIDVTCFPGCQIVLVAARTQNYQLLSAVLELPGVNPNIYDELGNTPLIYCVESGNMEAIRLLVSHPKTEVNRRNFAGSSAFSTAVECNAKEILQFLTTCPKFDLEESNASFALARAISLDMASTVNILLRLDFDINRSVKLFSVRNHRSEMSKRFRSVTALMVAVSKRDIALVTSITQHPRFDPIRSDCRRALFTAVKTGDVNIFHLILGLIGNDVNFRNKRDESVLVYVCLKGSVGMVNAIIALPGFRMMRGDGMKALAAAIRADFGPLIPLLSTIDGIDVNAKFPRGVNSRRNEAWNMNEYDDNGDEIRGGWPDVPIGVPPIIAALRTDRQDAFSRLLTAPNVDLNVTGEHGQPLLFELLRNAAKLNSFLEQEGRYDINVRDSKGDTALMYAIWAADRAAIPILIRRGIDLSLRNLEGLNAWDVAHIVTRMPSVMPEPTNREEYIKKLMGMLADCNTICPWNVGI